MRNAALLVFLLIKCRINIYSHHCLDVTETSVSISSGQAI